MNWKTPENLARSFTRPTLFNAHGHDYSQRVPVSTVPGVFFNPRTGPCSRASPELIYYGGRNVPGVMLTLVIGNNVCRERVEKRGGERRKRGYGKRERVRREFFTPTDPFNSRRIRAARNVQKTQTSPSGESFRGNVAEENARNNSP